jgi:tetratricopeptide (TPR) repeat protein
MAEKRSWPRIDLRALNVLLCGLIGLCVVVWWSELHWAARELPRFLQGRIGSPVERKLFLRAKKLIQAGRDLDTARALLDRSMDIDPYSDAVYWMGECLLAVGEMNGALESFRRYLEFDPTRVDAYLRVSEILEDQGRGAEARDVLKRGLRYFESARASLEPRPDPEVEMKYNRKALDLYTYNEDSIARLRVAVAQVERRGSGS